MHVAVVSQKIPQHCFLVHLLGPNEIIHMHHLGRFKLYENIMFSNSSTDSTLYNCNLQKVGSTSQFSYYFLLYPSDMTMQQLNDTAADVTTHYAVYSSLKLNKTANQQNIKYSTQGTAWHQQMISLLGVNNAPSNIPSLIGKTKLRITWYTITY